MCCCSCQAWAISWRRRAESLSWVELLSIDPPRLAVVVAPAQVEVRDGSTVARARVGGGHPVESMLQNRFDMTVGACAHRDGAGAGQLETRLAVALGEP